MSRFLPPGNAFPFNSQDGAFAEGPTERLEQIGSAMNVKDASTLGRIPSPVTRAYLFYANLFLRSLGDAEDRDEGHALASKGRQTLQAKARRTLRGLLATFALRDVLDLDIRLRSIRLSENATDTIRSVLVPALQATPGGTDQWNPVRFYTIWNDGTEEVLAGRSPLTGIYPAATPPKRLSGLYWYDHAAPNAPVQWYDPTSEMLDPEGAIKISPETRERMRVLMKAWLEYAISNVGRSKLKTSGMEDRDAEALLDELIRWRDDLYSVAVPDDVEVDTRSIADDNTPAFPLLDIVVDASDKFLWSDLPIHDGRLLVTHEQLRSENVRVYGRYFGGSSLFKNEETQRNRGAEHYDTIIQSLPREGENLGQALGLGSEAIPVPFLNVDNLFTPNLTILTTYDPEHEERGGLSAEWKGLEIQTNNIVEYCLLPFDPKILEIIDAETLLASAEANLSRDGQNYIVRLRFGETTITKQYSATGDGAYCIDQAIGRDQFDLRLFPNYDVSAVRHLITASDDGAGSSDDVYYARLRLSPHWDFRDVHPFAKDAEGAVRMRITDNSVEVGDEIERGGSVRSTGAAMFYSMSTQPDGFHVPDRGFCLLDLKDPRKPGQDATEWAVGIDFGTSNTCLAVRNASDEAAEPEILQLPVLTTTLLERPNYNAQFGHVFEGASAALDFFYNFSGGDDALMSQLYFPTQILTQQEAVSPGGSFEVKNGLIYFDNISLADPTLLSLIRGFPQVQSDVAQRFNLKQDIKWDNRDWLKVFMLHLRKQVVLTAAKENRRITDIHFSYPKSFTYTFRNDFRDDLEMVWGDLVDTRPLPMTSESEAARDYVVEGYNQHIIFDVGGGTTDIIAFDGQAPIFQTSFRLAAGQMNDYVLASPDFRRLFVEAVKERAPRVLEGQISDNLLEKFQSGATSAKDKGVVLQLWLGLLQRISDVSEAGRSRLLERTLNHMRSQAEGANVVKGFFLTSTLLMGGLSYYTGQLLRVAADGGFDNEPFELSKVTLTLTGNGSRLYNVLGDAEYAFDDVMEQLFRAGAKIDNNDLRLDFEGLYDYNGTPAPKVTVALGLLRSQDGDEMEDIPTANVAAEAGYPMSEGETSFDTSLVELYQSVLNRDTRFEPPRTAPPNLTKFFDVLGEAMPYGKNGQFPVVPGVAEHWTNDLKGPMYTHAVPDIKNRGYANAQLAEGFEKMPENERPALEPLFIAQLVGLIDAIREEYAA
ncbi:acetate and sugar kinases/Hsc70/actin family protein [Salisaeta longa]|uniref:hypothetical protein n=1 Tax=Salisaeta longa TaxID=503170 RepID=UPI0012FAB3E3|nr:hypothetical protein [Salisaeta longa]